MKRFALSHSFFDKIGFRQTAYVLRYAETTTLTTTELIVERLQLHYLQGCLTRISIDDPK